MVVCGSCGQQVEEESTNCPRCGGLVSTLPLALDFAWRYESMSRAERGVDWRRLTKHEREEAERLVGGSVDVAAPRRRLLLLILLLVVAVSAAVAVRSRGKPASAGSLADNPVASALAVVPPPLLQPLSRPELIPPVCDGGLVLPESAVVTEPATLYTAPSRTSQAVVRLEQNTLLSVRCRRSDWARLEVEQPPRLRGSVGWVPVELLERPAEARAQLLRRIDSVLDLSQDLRRYQGKVVEALVDIITGVPRCGVVDLTSVAMWQEGGAEPQFSVVCNPGEAAFNYWFDLEGRELRRPPALAVAGETRAERCRAAVVGAASVPSSVSFDGASAVDVEHPPGTRRLVARASAADSRGATRDYRVLCVFENDELMTWALAES